jgi:hypothetical protein
MRNLAFVVALGGLLGWSAFLSRRADGPSRMAETAQEVRGLYEALDAFVQENQGCVDVDLEACEACQPIVRMALPTGKTCATARARVVLEANAIGGACRRTPEELTCGDRP